MVRVQIQKLRSRERKAVLGTDFGHVGMLPLNLLRFTFQLQNPLGVGLLTKQNLARASVEFSSIECFRPNVLDVTGCHSLSALAPQSGQGARSMGICGHGVTLPWG